MNQKIKQAIANYSMANGYAAERFAAPNCDCGAALFSVAVDDEVGALESR